MKRVEVKAMLEANSPEKRVVTKLSSRANAFSIESIIATHEDKISDEDGKESYYDGEMADGNEEEMDKDFKGQIGCATSVLSLPMELPASTDHNHLSLKNLECTLEATELWKQFHELGTEMIITKTGRRMFPTIRVSFTGPSANSKYVVIMDIIPVDNKRYRYAYHKSSWLVAGKADPPVSYRVYFHNETPITESQLSKQLCSFEKLKLTNNALDRSGHVVLNSMHKYQPRIHVIRADRASVAIDCLKPEDYKTFVFPETQFTAVTAYQNQLITRLKIDSNPFAKGFRDSSRLNEYERDSVESLLNEGRMMQPSSTAAMELLLDQRMPYLPTMTIPNINGQYIFPTITPARTTLTASQRYIRYCQQYHRELRSKIADRTHGGLPMYAARSKSICSQERQTTFNLGDLTRLGPAGIASLQKHIFTVPRHHGILRHSSANKESISSSFDRLRYQPYPALTNAARLRQLYACWDAATSTSKSARIIAE